MPPGKWVDSPRRLLGLLLATGGLLICAMLWLGWQLAQQDREVAAQRLLERREGAADLAVATLQRALSQAEERVTQLAASGGPEQLQQAAAISASLPDDSLQVLGGSDAIETFPSGRLLFYPTSDHQQASPTTAFDKPDALEIQKQDYAGALALLTPLARSDNHEVRAGALVRVAGIHRRLRHWTQALAAYDALETLEDALVEAVPAELVARQARLHVFLDSGQAGEARRQAAGIVAGLHSRRWRLTRGGYEFYASEAALALGQLDEQEPAALALTQAVESAVVIARSADGQTNPKVLTHDGIGHLAITRGPKDRFAILVLGPSWVTSQIGSPHGTGAPSVALGLTDAEGAPVAGVAQSVGLQTVRLMATTHLPWNLHVFTTHEPAAVASSEARQRLLLGGLAITMLLLGIGIWLIGRSLSQQLATSRTQSDFVAAVSHEFRTPLSSLCLITELLESGRVAGEVERTDYYAVLSRESQRLRRLVEGLLNFGRMEAGAMNYRFEVLDPVEVVREVSGEFQKDLDRSGYTIDVSVANETPLISADRSALRCVIWNLLDNAVKYSPGCHIVWVNVGRSADHASIDVRDRGLGISVAEQPDIFSKFVRGRASSEAGVVGTGVGLALVRHIVSAHHGEIHIESRPGEGSTFTIMLPAVR